ncbi:PAS domain S-box protein [Blastococcus sp. CT_GayMR20]|uniref:SpoIIE family protein phosphatase n=1 Tax=Blastococcus sp. CT_GayMR20 TaxID=2559609 RepID=UPI001074204F|nr:SpoIIE family protein phosphatase [Blastococcus sp. CT_GayMR20]TFV91622.1 PAS domain S-box protein [Blastococcus sp. CT_GayMR20]
MPTSLVAAPALLEALPDVVVVVDRDGRIIYANPALRSLLGQEPAEMRGRPLTVLLPERLRDAYAAGFARILGERSELSGPRTSQIPVLHTDGSEVTVEITLSRLDDPGDGNGTVVGGAMVGVLRDVSTSVRLERQLDVARHLNATLRVTTALTDAPDADVAFERLLPTLCAELDWDAATLWEPEACGGRLGHTSTWTSPGRTVPALQEDTRIRTFVRGEGLPGLVWKTHEPVVVEDLWRDGRFLRRAAARGDGLRTAVAFPILRGNTLLGVCELYSREARSVPPELLGVLASAGRQIGQFLARLRAESQLRELADTLQRSLLPAHLPDIPGVQLAARYRAGADGVFVGGDTYDVLPLPGDRWMVLIADVCGTGAEAAAITSLTRHTARACALTGAGPADVLAAVNTALLHEQQTGGPLRFVTACCLVIEPHAAGVHARVSVAGHPLPLLRCADGSVTEVGTPGQPLGIDAGARSGDLRVELSAGSTLVLYTDGVTEARDDTGAQFGEDALLRVVGGPDCLTAGGAVAAVHDAVASHLRGSRHGADDLAVLALRC